MENNLERPFWSVMIPTFDSNPQYLRQTLASVLAQDPGSAQMQIEVVDNCSTKFKPEALVEELGAGRITFHRNQANLGGVGNFNMCIQRSRGQWVHILHSDDFLTPTFYSQIGALAKTYPTAALIASQVHFVNQLGDVTGFSSIKRFKTLGAISRDCSAFYYSTPLQFVGTVVRRNFYERHGGFDPHFPYCGDCEMWTRAISTDGGVIIPEPLAYYRRHGQDDVSSVIRSAENLRELDQLGKLFAARYPDFSKHLHRKRMSRAAWNQAKRFKLLGKMDGYEANMAYWNETANLFQKIKKTPELLRHKFLAKK